MNGIIYKATNTVNGKEYIGLTTTSLKQRICSHKCASERKNPIVLFSKAMKKYGFENFTFIEIDSFTSVDEGNQKEIKWISHYHTYVDDPLCNGYNLTTGGDFCIMSASSRAEQGKKMKSKWSNPVWRKRQLEVLKAKVTSDDYRTNMSKTIKERWSNDIFRQKMESPEMKEKIYNKQVSAWAEKREERILALTKAQNSMTPEQKQMKKDRFRKTILQKQAARIAPILCLKTIYKNNP